MINRLKPLIVGLAFVLVGCEGASQKISEKTGTTIEQRCTARVTGLEVYKAQPEYSAQNKTGETLRRIAAAYKAYTSVICPPPWGLAAPTSAAALTPGVLPPP